MKKQSVKKALQRLHFLRQLDKFGLRREILVKFYRSAIESILAFSVCVWFDGISQRQRRRLDRVVKTVSKIVGSALTPQRQIKKTDKTHHLFELFQAKKMF